MTTGRITVQTAAKVLKMDAQTVRLLLRQGLVDWGLATKLPGSKQWSYIIYAAPFKQLTGYEEGGEQE